MSLWKNEPEYTGTAREAITKWLINNQDRLSETTIPALAAIIGREIGSPMNTVRCTLLAMAREGKLKRISGNRRFGNYVIRQDLSIKNTDERPIKHPTKVKKNLEPKVTVDGKSITITIKLEF